MRTYLFDIDGTLVNARGSGRSAFDTVMLRIHGIPEATKGLRFGGKTDAALIDELYQLHFQRDATIAERDAFIAAYLPELRGLIDREGVQLIPGVTAALDFLNGRARLGIATGNVKQGAALKLAAAGLHTRFAFGGYGCDSPRRAELVAKGIERARALGTVDEVIVVGDTVHDITAARACGATVCAVTTGGDDAHTLRDADVVFSSLAELPAWDSARV